MIDKWLSEFKHAWIEQDIDRVIRLFVEDVEYWETPFRKLKNIEEVHDEWKAINSQANIDLSLSVYASIGGKNVVTWNLTYVDLDKNVQNWAGLYLIELNDQSKCIYFYQAGEHK